jgi:hypothetical protein
MKFSPSQIAFYDPKLEAAYKSAKTWPSDLIDLFPSEAHLSSNPAPSGKRLGVVGGRPAWVNADRQFIDADAAMRVVSRRIERVAQQITGPVPEDEKASWPEKLAIARAVLSGDATEEQQVMLMVEANQTGESLTELAGYIVNRAQAYSTAIMHLTGIRRRVSAEIAAADPSEYGSIVDGAMLDIDNFLAGMPV